MDDDKVFKALADPSRRTLLDLLFERDGRTLGELYAPLAEMMTRFGCMKHLAILEEAGLLTTRKVGREKHHFLNAVPIQQVYDRWVSKFSQSWTERLTALKYVLEEESVMSANAPHVFQIFIRTTPEKLWQALTDGAISQQYYFGTRVESTWAVGATYHYASSDGSPQLAGEVIEIDPPRKLVMSFRVLWDATGDPTVTSTVTYEITPLGPVCKLTLTHEGLELHSASAGLTEGWAQILSGLKTYLETGEPMPEAVSA
jgi:uncharacterized protein YndB with AHSA1/START domain